MKLNELESAQDRNLRTWLSSEHWKERLISFNASWFVLTMGTGVVVQNLSNFPYEARWIMNLAYCFWVLDIVIFVFFLGMATLRLLLFPDLSKSFYLDFIQTSYLGAIPVTLDTVIFGIVTFYHDHPAAIWTAWGMWWLALGMSLCVGSLVVVFVCEYQEPHELTAVTGVWLLSFIPFIVSSGIGANMVPHLPATPAAATLIVSYLSWSLGVLMAHLILGIYLYRLFACSLPAREAIVSCFIPMGPTGMGAYSIQLLAVAFSSVIHRTSFTFSLPAAGPPEPLGPTGIIIISQAVHWSGVFIGLFLVASATFWLIFAFTAVSIRIPRHFNVGFWSFVFPCGVYTNALCELASNFRNNGFKGYAAFMVVVTILLWCLCTACTVYKAVWHAELLFAPGLEGWNERMAMKKLRGEQSEDDLPPTNESKPEDMSERSGRSDSSPSSNEAEGITLSAGEMMVGPDAVNDGSDRPVARVSRPDGSYSLARWRKKLLPV